MIGERCASWLRPGAAGMALLIGAMLLPRAAAGADESPAQSEALRKELGQYPARIVYETFRDDNWELFAIDANGGKPVNLTNTPKAHELYPQVSPDGTKVSFVVDEREGPKEVRSVYYMNLDGTGRKQVARHARQECWKADGTAIAFLKSENTDRLNYMDYATKGIFIHDLKTGETRQHPNEKIHHLYNLCWTPDGKWFVATVHAGMGFKHAILAIEADGMGVHDLRIPGCRPDVSPDGKRVVWGATDWELRVGELDFSGATPRVLNKRAVVTSGKPLKIYHTDWSPDGKYVAFSRGPNYKKLGLAPEIVGIKATGWNICVADAAATNRWVEITTDGNCNKEPDWVPAEDGK